ncbi:zinc/cadmium/mercury/lead-transporting ATPase [Lelliottia amnigena]|nr:zinc/cadmium/mercury/lead-transporting ATPase [Lelliottia amnigena]
MSTPDTSKKVPQFSALKLSPVPAKEDCCSAGTCDTQSAPALPASGERYTWVVNGMDCAACARKVENAVKQVAGVNHVQVLFATEKLLVSAENDVSADVEAAVTKAGYSLRAEDAPAEKVSPLRENLAAHHADYHDGVKLGAGTFQPSFRQSGVYRHHAGGAVPYCASGAAPDEKRELVCD